MSRRGRYIGRLLLLMIGLFLIFHFYNGSKMAQNHYVEKERSLQLSSDRKRVIVTVFYECLCPDSKSFILNHLLPSYEKAQHLLKLELIPYGKAETRRTFSGSYEFECQHGSRECFGNKVHACVIDQVRDEMKALKLLSCLMEDNGSIEEVGAECTKKLNVSWSPLLECAKGKEGSLLLKHHGEATAALNPPISFVPTILLNYKRDGQPAILKNLWKEICRNLPEERSLQLSSDRKRVIVTVFYECLCPDSKSFILNHLLPSYEKAQHLLKLELIPYGKAETRRTFSGSYEFECQHGSRECFGNKVHACVIDQVRDEMKALKLLSCLMEDNGSIEEVGAECTKKLNVSWSPLLECAKGKEGSLLLKHHGEATAALNPPISFVPTILLNYKRDGQPAILKNLWKEICRNLPEETTECH